MFTIKSPLSALGLIVALIEAISTSALFAIKSQPELQKLLVIIIAITVCIFVITVIIVVLRFAFTEPKWLFDPSSFYKETQKELYGSNIKDESKVKLERNNGEETKSN